MPHPHSVFPVDHFTRGIPDEALRGLVSRHAVTYELSPHQVVGPDRELTRRGWEVDLYGQRSAADDVLSRSEASQHVHDVLHAVAVALVPDEHRGALMAELERYTGAVRVDPHHDFREEVRLRIQLQPHTTARMSMIDDADTAWRDEIVERLETLGARPRGG